MMSRSLEGVFTELVWPGMPPYGAYRWCWSTKEISGQGQRQIIKRLFTEDCAICNMETCGGCGNQSANAVHSCTSPPTWSTHCLFCSPHTGMGCEAKQ